MYIATHTTFSEMEHGSLSTPSKSANFINDLGTCKEKDITLNQSAHQSKQCLVCGKHFRRLYTLRRHGQIHDSNRPVPQPRRKACLACRRSKIRCPGEHPSCSSCLQRNTACQYDEDVVLGRRNSGSDTPLSHTMQSFSTTVPPPPGGIVDEGNIAESQDGARSSTSYVLPSAFSDLYNSDPFSGLDIHSLLDWTSAENGDDSNSWNWFGLGSQSIIRPPISGADDSSLHVPHLIQTQSQSVENVVSQENNSPLEHLEVPESNRNGDSEERYPMLWPATCVQPLTLPALGKSNSSDVLSSYFSLPRLGIHGTSALKDILKVPFEQLVWPLVSISSFPSSEKLDYCIDLYFAHFDKWVPIIHQATFEPGKEPVLTLILIAIGACYTDFEGGRAFSISLSELSRRLLVFMAEHDPRFVRTEYYLSAQLLNSIYGFSSGRQQLYELAESNRGALVNHARCMGLFNERHASKPNISKVQERWESWILTERSRRLAWAVYAYDASSATMRNGRPYILLNDLKMNLPCLTKHWKAGTAQAWTTLHPWAEEWPQTDSFEACISLVIKSPSIAHFKYEDDYNRFIILTALNRMIWDNKEATTHQGAVYLMSYNALLQVKAELLQIIDDFMSTTYGYPYFATKLPNEVSVHQLILANISHGLAEGPIACDFMFIMLWQDNDHAVPARHRISQWVKEHSRDARSLLFSCCQMLTLTRLYPCNHPQEAWNAFHGGVAASVLSKLLSSDYSVDLHSGILPEMLPVCNLDWHGDPNGPEALAVRDWVNHGTPSIVRMHGVPEVFSPDLGPKHILQQTADVLSNMSVWGIKHILLNAVKGLLYV